MENLTSVHEVRETVFAIARKGVERLASNNRNAVTGTDRPTTQKMSDKQSKTSHQFCSALAMHTFHFGGVHRSTSEHRDEVISIRRAMLTSDPSDFEVDRGISWHSCRVATLPQRRAVSIRSTRAHGMGRTASVSSGPNGGSHPADETDDLYTRGKRVSRLVSSPVDG